VPVQPSFTAAHSTRLQKVAQAHISHNKVLHSVSSYLPAPIHSVVANKHHVDLHSCRAWTIGLAQGQFGPWAGHWAAAGVNI
jgi:hypothetical protein